MSKALRLYADKSNGSRPERRYRKNKIADAYTTYNEPRFFKGKGEPMWSIKNNRRRVGYREAKTINEAIEYMEVLEMAPCLLVTHYG